MPRVLLIRLVSHEQSARLRSNMSDFNASNRHQSVFEIWTFQHNITISLSQQGRGETKPKKKIEPEAFRPTPAGGWAKPGVCMNGSKGAW